MLHLTQQINQTNNGGNNVYRTGYRIRHDRVLRSLRRRKRRSQRRLFFIDAKEELRIDRTNAWLEPIHIKKISDAYWKFNDAEGFAKVMNNKEVLENKGNLSLQLYVKQAANTNEHKTEELIADIKNGQKQLNASLEDLFVQLKNIGIEV